MEASLVKVVHVVVMDAVLGSSLLYQLNALQSAQPSACQLAHHHAHPVAY